MTDVTATTDCAGRARARLGLVVALIALIGALVAPGMASAGELAYRGCVTENRELGPSGSGACVRIPHSGLNGPTSVALSPDGKSLYTAGYARVGALVGYAMTLFDRDPVTGALTYHGCITGDPRLGGPGGCEVVPGATHGGWGSGLQGVLRVTVSPLGDSVYAAGSDTVAHFDRDPATGALTYRGCITDDPRAGPSGSGACEIASAAGAGMGDLSDVAVSPDGESLYITSPATGESSEAAVARFDRDPTGALTYRGCISGNKSLGPSGTGACALIPSASREAIDSGLSPVSLSVSPDGKSLYTGSVRSCDKYDCYGSTAVARFGRDPTSGALTYRGCITGDKRAGPSGSGACAAIPSATKEGNHSGLDGGTLASSPDGKTLYVGGSDVARLQRNTSTGALSYKDCITGDKRSGPSGSGACDAIPSATKDGSRSGLSGNALAMSPDGKTLFAGGHSEVARLDRVAATGALEFRDCVTGFKLSGPSGTGACDPIRSATEGGRRTASRGGARSGLGNGILALTPSPDGASLYSASCCYYDGSLVARFGFAPRTRITEDRTHGHKAVFRFRGGKPSTFECKLKGRRVKPKLEEWRSCGSDGLERKGRKVYRGLRSGKKVFRVRASDEVGNTDPTPAKRRWRVR